MAIHIPEVTFTGWGEPEIELDEGFTSLLVVEILTPRVVSAPSAISVSVADAMLDEEVVFTILGQTVFREDPDPSGAIELLSIPVPDLKSGSTHLMQPGTYELVATQGTAIGTAEFTVLDPPPEVPEILSPDALPNPVPGAIQPNGVRRWVFQDLMPGGLGSWVLPMNPKEMGSPAFTRELTARTTTADVELGGQFHVYEDAFTPVEWTFTGYAPTPDMQDQLEAYADLNRRWYLHDHRGRAWKVTFQNLELEPHLVEIWNGDVIQDGHTYNATVLVLERDWIEVP